jgi:uncharacterized membrane protein
MSRFLKIFIAISVLLNLLLAGLFIGHAGRHLMGAHTHPTMKEMSMTLPADQRERFETSMQQAEQDTGERRQQLSDARKKAAEILKAEPFDKKAYLAQMQEIQKLHGEIMQHMMETMAQLAEQSTPKERAALADMLRHPARPPSDE